MKQTQPINRAKALADLAETQFREALGRVGAGLNKNADWFLKFAEMALDTLTREQRIVLWHDLLALIILATRLDPSKAGERLSTVESGSWNYLESWPMARNPVTGVSEPNEDYDRWWQWVQDLHFQIQERIEAALDREYPPLRLSDIALQLTPDGLVPLFPLDMFVKKDTEGKDIRGADGAILIRLSLMLHKCGRHLHECPACQSPFIAVRRGQRFCSQNCRARIGMQRWRSTNAASKRGAKGSERKSIQRPHKKSKG